MKDPSQDEAAALFEWYSKFKTVQWDERISTPSLISGSNIEDLNQRKKEKYEYVRTLERLYGLNKDEESACASDSIVEFLHFLI